MSSIRVYNDLSGLGSKPSLLTLGIRTTHAQGSLSQAQHTSEHSPLPCPPPRFLSSIFYHVSFRLPGQVLMSPAFYRHRLSFPSPSLGTLCSLPVISKVTTGILIQCNLPLSLPLGLPLLCPSGNILPVWGPNVCPETLTWPYICTSLHRLLRSLQLHCGPSTIQSQQQPT